ncbi:acid stress-induced BolA-like protein IbaG/YrbA [Ewingella americana]|jgi:acid stress-induced BolA-like protein IbaG/YrbA|nr:transcriptional regulator BolA [Ewingella americana]
MISSEESIPMDTNEIKDVLMNALALDEAHITGDGSHFQAIVVGAMFDGMSRVKKQQTVYAPLMEYIADNRIHALSIKAYTPEEWQRDRKLNGF